MSYKAFVFRAFKDTGVLCVSTVVVLFQFHEMLLKAIARQVNEVTCDIGGKRYVVGVKRKVKE